jgi:CRP/FNR family cyclic AMP-dependent transcriptional regulator
MDVGSDPGKSLRDIPQFGRLGEADLRAVVRSAGSLTLRRGKAAYYQGDRATVAFLILSGTIRTTMYRSDESSIDVGRLGRGEWAGVAELLLDSPYLTDAIAEESSCLLSFTPPAFGGLLRIADMKGFFLRGLARRLYTLHGRIGLTHPLARLIHYLLSECTASESPQAPPAVRRTQEEIAEAIGVTRETVNRHLGYLQARGFIEIGRGEIALIDADGMRDHMQ